MRSLRYIWHRRNVVKRVTKNWLLKSIYEPFRPNGDPGQKAVIFVRQTARSRIFNHGYVLRKNEGVRTILLTKFFDYKFQCQAFDEIHTYSNNTALCRKVEQLSRHYNLLGVVGSTQPAESTRFLIDMERTWPVVVDQHDSYWSTMFFSNLNASENKKMDSDALDLDYEIKEEEYIFRNADGVIVRSGELKILFHEVNITSPYIFMEDGCNPINYQPVNLLDTPKNDEWSVAYAGIIYSMNRNRRHYGALQFVPLGKWFAEEKIHFHIYPSPLHEYTYPAYHIEAARNPFFHIHAPMGYQEIQRELSQYDFGWFSIDVVNAALTDSKVYRENSISAKVFTYLEAGLPVICNADHKRIVEILQQSGAGLILEDPSPRGLRAVIEHQNTSVLNKGVVQAQNNLDVNRRSKELFRFIQEVGQPYYAKK